MIERFKESLITRFIISILIALVIGWGISESAYLIIGEDLRRPPGQIEIVIPAGTADKIASGEASGTLPDEMSFVAGDELVIVNQDSVSHQLGPVWVPPGSVGSLNLEQPKSYSLACSFQPGNYFGLDVRERVTPWLRFQGIVAIGAPSGVLLGLYSLLVYPMKNSGESE